MPEFESSLTDLLDRGRLATSILMTLPDVSVIAFDHELRVRAATGAGQLVAGSRPEDLVGLHLTDVLPDGTFDRCAPHCRLALAGERSELELAAPDDSRVLDCTFSPLPTEQEKPAGAVMVCRDVTELRAARTALTASEQHYRLLAEDATDVVTRIAPDGTMLEVSPSSLRLFGYSPSELVGRSCFELVDERDLAELRKAVAVLTRNHHSLTRRYRLQRKDGTTILVETTARPHHDASGRVVDLHLVTRDITDREEADALRRRFDTTFSDAPIGVALVSPEGTLMRVNPALCEIFGRDEEGLVGIAPLEFVHVDEARRIGRSFSDLASEDVTVMAEEILFVTPDGNPVWVKALSSTVRDDDGEALYYIAYVQDITAQRAIREQERAATERFETAFDAAPIGMALVAPDRSILRANRSLCELLGYSEADLQTRTFADITHPDDLASDAHDVDRIVSGEIERYTKEKRYFHADGHVIWVNLSVAVVRHDDDSPQRFISQIEDISERKGLEASLNHLAHHDALTGLWNRRRFEEALQQQVARCRRYGEQAAFLMIDLDDFKAVNDGYGHAVGDALLQAIAAELTARVRGSDALGRLGGDEFVVLLNTVTPDQAAALAGELEAAITATTVEARGTHVCVGASIGVTFMDQHVKTAHDVFVASDNAMYAAKPTRSTHRPR